MTGTQGLAAVSALLTAAGLWVVAAGIAGRPRADRADRDLPWRRATRAARGLRRYLTAALVAVPVWAVSGWPALGLGAAVTVVGLPSVLGQGRRATESIARIEGVEEWARRVADLLAIGVGVEQAIQTSSRSAPPAVAPEVATLAARIAARTPTEDALRRFGDELADPAADLVVAALILAVRRRGPGVAAALTAIAGSVGEEVAARRRIEADRARPRTTARVVTLITGAIVLLGVLNPGYTQPYATELGQAVLAATLVFFAASLGWMHSMTASSPHARILEDGSAE